MLPQALASMVATLVGGRLVDRIGVRAVMIPGLILLAIGNWELSTITLYSPYWWIQVVLIIRGLALGLVVQPLTVASLSEIRPRQLAQASSLSTVVRAVSSSLGIAVLATLVQTQALVHYAHLAEQVTASSRLGQLLPEIEALFVSHGYSLPSARSAGLLLINELLQGQSFVLAVQDAFKLTVFVVGIAIIATLFVGGRRRPARIPEASPPVTPTATEEAEEHVFVMVE